MLSPLSDNFAQLQGWLFEPLIEPLIYARALGAFIEQAFEGTEWLLIGLFEITVLFVVLRPLEAVLPAQPMTDPRARWNDFIYTAIHRLGAFAVVIFFVLDPLMDQCATRLHLEGIHPFNLDNVWPGVTDIAIVTFIVYLVVLDFFDYWFHRAEHQFNWSWTRHGLHHSQQNMNLWRNNRNYLLDDFLHDFYFAVIALAVGVPTGQYVLLIAISRMVQSLQHADVRLHFGWLGERLVVSPRYHRLHHVIGIGHESAGRGTLGGHNFAILFPVWDVIFRTRDFGRTFEPTGVRDQLPAPHGISRQYGESFWSQQWLGLKRLIGRDRTIA